MSQSRTSRRSSLAASRLPTALLKTTLLIVVDLFFANWLILLDWRLVIDWWCSQSSLALYRASGNRYFPFSYGPLVLFTLGPNYVVPVSTAYNWNPTSRRLPADSPMVCGTPGSRSAAEMALSKVHGRVQSPVRSVISFCIRHPHSAIEDFTLHLSPTSRSPNSLSPNSLSPNSLQLPFSKLSFFTLSFLNFSFSKLSSSPCRYYALIRRVSVRRQSLCEMADAIFGELVSSSHSPLSSGNIIHSFVPSSF